MPIRASSPTLALKAPVYRFRLVVLLIVLLFSHTQQNRTSLTQFTVRILGSISAFPVAENSDFTHNEYLNIYPKIQIVNGTWWVWLQDPIKLVELPTWLRQ